MMTVNFQTFLFTFQFSPQKTALLISSNMSLITLDMISKSIMLLLKVTPEENFLSNNIITL